MSRVLVTSSRMPFALGMVRQLAAAGHEVHAADDYALSPGNHSRYLEAHHVYPSPRNETEAFIDALERIVTEAEIDAIVPAFEEAFYLSTQRDRLSQATTVFAGRFSNSPASTTRSPFSASSASSACRSPRR